MDLVKAIQELAGPIVERSGAFLVECIVRSEHGGRVVEVYIDSDSGVTTDVCASISRDLGMRLDAADLIKGRYRLEVSSPGLDRPLKLFRQYPKNVGRTVTVKYSENGETKTITGLLKSVTTLSIVLETEQEPPVEIQFSALAQATVEPSFKQGRPGK